MARKELRIIMEEELIGDPSEIASFLVDLKEEYLNRGNSSLQIERYYGDECGYLVLTGHNDATSDRFDSTYWDTLEGDLDEYPEEDFD